MPKAGYVEESPVEAPPQAPPSNWWAENAPTQAKSTQNVSTKTPPKDTPKAAPKATKEAPHTISAAKPSFLDRITAPFTGEGSAYGTVKAQHEGSKWAAGQDPFAKPLIDLNAVKAEDLTSNKTARGAIRGVEQVATDFTTPQSVELAAATGGLAKLPVVGKLVSAGFGLTQIKGAIDRYPEFKKNLADGNYEDATKVLTEMALGAEMGRRALNHAGSKTETVSRPEPPRSSAPTRPYSPELAKSRPVVEPEANVSRETSPPQNPPNPRKVAPKATVPVEGISEAEQRADFARAQEALANYKKTRKTPPWENRPLKNRAKIIAQQQEEAAKQKTPAEVVKPAPEDVSRETLPKPAPEDDGQSRLPLGAPRPIESLPEPKAAAPVVPPKPVGELELQDAVENPEYPWGDNNPVPPYDRELPGSVVPLEGKLKTPKGDVSFLAINYDEQGTQNHMVLALNKGAKSGLVKPSGQMRRVIANKLLPHGYSLEDVVGVADITPNEDGGPGLHSEGTYVDESWRRNGIASKMYDHAESIIGRKLNAASVRTSDGDSLQSSRGSGVKDVNGKPVTPNDPKPVGSLGLQDRPKNPGAIRTVSTPKQTKAKVQWKISPADELNTSFGEGYEQAYQPRNTDTKATATRLMQRKGDMAFGAMADSYMAGDGAPITKLNEVTNKHDAVTRNHGLEALKQLYSENSPRSEEYRKEVIDNAQVAGMTPEEVATIKNPVLHRVLMEDWDKEKIGEFAKEANQSSTARMTSGEIAKHMADKMTSKVMESFDPSESGKPNAEFVRNLIEHLPIEEKNAFFDKNNDLNQTGERAVRNAVFAKAYPNRGAIERMAESTDDRVKNVTNGMLRAAANVARMQDGIEKGDLHNLSIAEELGDAAQMMDELRTNKKNVQDWLEQEKIGGRDPIIEKLVKIFMDESRRQRLIGDFISNYAKSVEGLGSPKQDSMFAMDVPTKEELLDNAYNEAKRADEERRKAEPAEPSLGFESGPVANTGQPVEPAPKVSKEPKTPKKPATKPEKVAETPKAAKGKTKPPTWR